MNIYDIQAIAEVAEAKRVRIELHPFGFLIVARAPTKNNKMVEIKQILPYTEFEESRDILSLTIVTIDEMIEQLRQKRKTTKGKL